MLANCLKIIDFCHLDCLTKILGLVFIFASNYYQTASFFVPGGHVNRKKNKNKQKKAMIFGQVASAAMLFAKFHAGTRKSLSGFWPPLHQ